MKTYNLVNPYVIGSMKSEFKATSSLSAAKQAWVELSQYFGNHLPKYNFTLESNNKLNHFQATETNDSKNNVSYEIKSLAINAPEKVVKSFQSRMNKVENQELKIAEKEGGGRYVKGPVDYDDDLSDYFYDYEKPRRGPLTYDPIVYYWYDPYIYPLSDRWYVPTFVLPIQPRVVIDSHSLLYLYR